MSDLHGSERPVPRERGAGPDDKRAVAQRGAGDGELRPVPVRSPEGEAGVQPASAPEESSDVSGEVDLVSLAAERDEYLDMLRRLQADFENYRKRMLRQQTSLLERAAEDLVVKLLPVLDALDLAETYLSETVASSPEGVALKQAASLLSGTLAKEGLERIDASGVAFDPSAHEAVEHELIEREDAAGKEPVGAERGQVSASAPDDGRAPELGAGSAGGPAASDFAVEGPVVSGVLRAGYRWKGRVVRPAMVKVRG